LGHHHRPRAPFCQCIDNGGPDHEVVPHI
jgi:hypothetical protein